MSEPISKGGTAHPRLTRQQKAAAVIVSLGTDKASQLYQYMDPEDVEQITLEVENWVIWIPAPLKTY